METIIRFDAFHQYFLGNYPYKGSLIGFLNDFMGTVNVDYSKDKDNPEKTEETKVLKERRKEVKKLKEGIAEGRPIEEKLKIIADKIKLLDINTKPPKPLIDGILTGLIYGIDSNKLKNDQSIKDLYDNLVKAPSQNPDVQLLFAPQNSSMSKINVQERFNYVRTYIDSIE